MEQSVEPIGTRSIDVHTDSLDVADTYKTETFPAAFTIKELSINEKQVPCKSDLSLQTIKNRFETNGSAFNTDGTEKKPSYISLACCVNGYSNITTYDSKIRKEINKSREVSPIRPTSNSYHQCTQNDLLAPPVIVSNAEANFKTLNTDNRSIINRQNNSSKKYSSLTSDVEEPHREIRSNTTIVQQCVERLYGPGAMTSTFISPRKERKSNLNQVGKDLDLEDNRISELAQKFKELSPSKDYNGFRKKVNEFATLSNRNCKPSENAENNNIDLPVLRHLSQEFRAQLPKIISPKKAYARRDISYSNGSQSKCFNESQVDEIDHQTLTSEELLEDQDKLQPSQPHRDEIIVPDNQEIKETKKLKKNVKAFRVDVTNIRTCENSLIKDGAYFLDMLQNEQSRLLQLAEEAESYIEMLTNTPEGTEDVLGLLRSASGKARLLVSQKMRQFEDLCHSNIHHSNEAKFRTTADDLQGFWDMLHLQIDNIDATFVEINNMKANGWERQSDTVLTSNNKQKKLKNTVGKTKSKHVIASSSNERSAAALKRESQRKQLIELKRKNKREMLTSLDPEGTVNLI